MQRLTLAIDIGNTSTQLAFFEQGELAVSFRLRTETFRSPDEYAVTLSQLLSLRERRLEWIQQAAICCVVPQALNGAVEFLRSYVGVEPFVLDDDADLPLELAVDRPSELGADRIANAVAAYDRFEQSCVVVDFGTGTTFDVIDNTGAYIGGVIAPGIATSSDAMWKRAAKLPRIEVERPANVVGRNTLDSLRSGLFFGYLGLIEGILERVGDELGTPPKVLATGGYAELFHADTDLFEAVDRLVTMRGLMRIYEFNRPPETLEA